MDEPFVLESAVESEDESEGNSGSGRGDRQSGDGDMTCCVWSFSRVVSGSGGIYVSGSGGTTSLELQSGHAPGKDGVGEAGAMVKEREKEEWTKEAFWGKRRERMTLFD